ncbi:MAG TPA: hypothetical protein DD435_05795 [Cyanobacteria bacterium UBA8530]|nr:hypothetical protein [Cyanobacteria bacterium UBA8530]
MKKRESYQIDHHPWVLEQRQAGDNLEGLLEPLSGRAWETVISHGDCAPWNLRACPRGLMAFDWEYGRLDGLPYLDLAYYLLQTAALIYRWSPSRAYDFAVRYLEKNEFALEIGEISAIVTLAAYTAYKQASLDGQPPDSRLQCWRSAIWRK